MQFGLINENFTFFLSFLLSYNIAIPPFVLARTLHAPTKVKREQNYITTFLFRYFSIQNYKNKLKMKLPRRRAKKRWFVVRNCDECVV